MDKINEKDTNTNLYFVTKADMKSKTTLEPRIPQNFLTDNGFEDNKIKRVCFSTSINGAVTALSQNLKNTDLFVYSPIGIEKRDIYTPSVSQVPDRSITGEVWIRKPVQIECIGKIHVIDAKKNPQRYKYGNKISELYEWNWKWIDKNINESVSSVYGAYDAHGKWNAAVDVDGRTYRYRVECLIINGDKVFVSLDKHGNLIIPGGSAEKDIDDITQVANECREEARINIKNPIYTGIDRIQGCPPHISKHKSVLPFEYDGSLSKVYVAEYDSDYNGYIDEYDKDEKMIRGKFVPIKDIVNRLKPEWREALNKYTNVYYRVTYNGEGIYNALKNNIPLNIWIDLLKSDAMRWLPKPPKYNESSRSYFTKEGFKMFMRRTYPVMRKYLNPEFVNIEEVRLPDRMMYSDKYQVVTESSETKYDPPYTYDEIVKNYGKDMADKLVAEPAHKFRCHTGIELIHKEPSLSELNRIYSNWQLMTDEQKRKSDMKSIELFGCDNEMKIIKKENGRFLGNILFKNYGTKGMMNKDFKSLNSNVNESVKRSELPDDVFGIPQERKYPMQDKQHVKAAIKFFNYVEPKYEEQLANRIIENMERYNIDTSSIGDKNRLKKYIKESTMEGSYSNMRESLADDLAFMYFESENDSSIPDLIEPIIKQIESKGYQVKYASPGHINTRFGNDKNKDGVINAKMTSTARIIFSRDYHFNTTPQGWEWKVLHNDAKALYVKPYTYNEKMGSKEDAFKKWQTFYISNIKTWAAELPKVGSDKKTAPDTNF